jgi:surface polysaccharide O-acyltransferase-like enzyme
MSRNISLDILKLVMAFMVVGLHTGFLGEVSPLDEYLTVNGLFRIAVPIFLIINGFYFFPVLAKKGQVTWLKRVLILYMIWMLLYSYFWFSVPTLSLIDITHFLIDIVVGYQHLWYVSGLLGAALILLIFQRFSSKILAVTVLISLLLGVLIQYLGNYHYFEGSILDKLFNMYWFHRNALFFSYPFFCIGYLINKHKIHDKISFKIASFYSVVGILLLILESYINFYQESRVGGFDNYLSLLVACPFIFILFTKLDISGSSKRIALYSSSVYFVHWFFLILFSTQTELESTSMTIACILTSLIASYFIIKINDRVKFLL